MELKAIENKVNELTLSRAKEIELIQNKINDTQERLDNAHTALITAQESGDAEAYAIAANEARTAQDVLGMLKRQLNEAASTPVISDEEYRNLSDEILTAMEEVIRETTAEYLKAVEKIQPLYNAPRI